MKLNKFRKTRKNIKQKGGNYFDEKHLLQFLDNLNKEIWENKYVLDNNIKKINGYINEIHAIKNKLDAIPNEQLKELLNRQDEIKTAQDIEKEVKENLFNPKKNENNINDLRENLEGLFSEINNEIADMLSPEQDDDLIEYVVNSDVFQEQIDNIYKMLGIYNLRPEVLFIVK